MKHGKLLKYFTAKLNKMTQDYVRICPVCNSVDVSPDLSVPAAVASGALYSYRCNRCGFVGVIFPEIPIDEVPEPRNFEKGYSVLDVTYGRGYLGLLRYLSPFGVLLSIALYLTSSTHFNLLAVILFSYLTLYLFGKKHFDKYRILKIIGIVAVILYALFYRLV